MSTQASRRGRDSAGILAYRRQGGRLEIFLVHPGGPYWAGKDEGVWSIPKGEYTSDEEPLAAAQREFQEETGLALTGTFTALPAVRQASGKRVSAWAVEAPELNPAELRSNSFTLEWPPRSGREQQFPEVDRAGWFELAAAERKLIAGQKALLQFLREQLEST